MVMQATLAGIPLNLPDEEISDYLATNIDPERATYWSNRSWPGLGLSSLSFPTGFKVPKSIRLNSFTWPRGASRWAFGHFLCDSQLLAPIQTAAFGTAGTQQNLVPLVISLPSATPLASDETLSTQVYLLPPTPLSYLTPPGGPSVNNLWLITVVDARYYWWNFPFPLTNIGVGGIAWTTLFSQCATALGISLTVDTISSNYLNASPNFNVSYEAIPIILDALCYNVGHRLIRKYDGTVYTQSFQTAYTARLADQSNNPYRAIRAGGDRFVTLL